MNTFLKRGIQLFVVLFGMVSIIFLLQRLIPGSPADMVLGPDVSDSDKQVWLEERGLTKPLGVQYVETLWGYTHGDLGNTYAAHEPVTEVLKPRLVQTLSLALGAFCLSLSLGTIWGIWGALRVGQFVDRSLGILSLVAIAAPTFVVGPLLMWIFAVHWNILPLTGYLGPSSYILPCLTLALPLSAFSGRMIRAGLVETLREDYIRTARSKGLPWTTIVFKHALRNACLPTITVLGLQLGVLLSGTVITEQIFAWPGLGSLLIDAVNRREYNVVSGCVLVIATIYVGTNFFVDILYRLLDPRIRGGT
jgi:peptide/nickel transport system permease protein